MMEKTMLEKESMEKGITDFYEELKPDEDARKRMLQNIQILAAQKQGKEGKVMKLNSKKIAGVAAAVAIGICIPAVGYASGIFNMGSTSIGKQQVQVYHAGEENIAREQAEVDIISLQGIADSPEHKACMEWQEFCKTYDTDEAILSKIGNNPTGFEDEYGEYLCYTQEMADKIDEICRKYKLSKLSGFTLVDDEAALCKQLGIKGNICEPETDTVKNTCDSGYTYADGSFHTEGTAVFKGKKIKTKYQFSRSVKGTFSTVILNVGNLKEYKQWQYVTKDGETVLLANSGEKALIMVEKEKSFLSVNVLGDLLENTFEVSNDDLEALADSFHFSAIS